jgi:hypothetical protein
LSCSEAGLSGRRTSASRKVSPESLMPAAAL